MRRARFTAPEVVQLTLAFYKRNYIEGLFLSSGIIGSSNYTMEQLVEVARSLREDHDFRGYIHLKTIPDADPELVRQAGLHADRVSINVELPTAEGLSRLAPEKDSKRIESAMSDMKGAIVEAKEASSRSSPAAVLKLGRRVGSALKELITIVAPHPFARCPAAANPDPADAPRWNPTDRVTVLLARTRA